MYDMFIFNNFTQEDIGHITDKCNVHKLKPYIIFIFCSLYALLLYKIILYLDVIVTHNNYQVSYHFKTLKKLS